MSCSEKCSLLQIYEIFKIFGTKIVQMQPRQAQNIKKKIARFKVPMDKVNHEIMNGPQVIQSFKMELPKSEDVFHLLVAIQVLSTRFKTVSSLLSGFPRWTKLLHLQKVQDNPTRSRQDTASRALLTFFAPTQPDPCRAIKSPATHT